MNDIFFELFLVEMQSLWEGYRNSVTTNNINPLSSAIDLFLKKVEKKNCRVIEVGKYLFQFQSLDDWKKNNEKRYGKTPFKETIAIDSDGRICVIRRNAEKASYPVKVYKVRRDI